MNDGPALSVRALKGAYRGERAAVVLGGPSLIEQRFDFDRLGKTGMVTFLESRAFTPSVVRTGFSPDVLLMLSPDKCLANALHNWWFRALLAGVRLEGFVRAQFADVVAGLYARQHEYVEPGSAERGRHKRYRWRPDVQLVDSPCDLIPSRTGMRLLAEQGLFERYCSQLRVPNERYFFDLTAQSAEFDRDRYYDVDDSGPRVSVRNYAFQNSAAIALYPLLRYLGFRTVYFLGMDMSMLGSMEYAAPFVFKSMWHFRWFFWRSRHVFNATYRPNRPWFARPRYEFDALRQLLDPSKIELVRVFSPYRYTVATPFMSSISDREFWSL